MGDNNQPTILTEEQQTALWDAELLLERLAELEMTLYDQGWRRFSSGSEDGQFSREALKQITALSRLMFLKNPLIKRGVKVQSHYVFGQGVTISSKDEEVQQVLSALFSDRANQAEITRHQSRMQKEIELQIEGNLFFVLFTSPLTVRVRVRTLPFNEVEEVLYDPEDRGTPHYYLRKWREKKEERIALYPAVGHLPTNQPESMKLEKEGRTGKSIPIFWDAPVYHVKVGGFSNMDFGVPEVYAAIDWARAYKEFLEDWATLTRAYSRFAHKLSVPGGSRGITAAKAKLQTTLASAAGGGAETNPPPVVGSTFIGGKGVDLTPLRIGGANVSSEDGRRLLLMVAAGVGLPESFFGDVSVGTLATAKSLDRPTELMMTSRQELWSQIFQDLTSHAVASAIRAGKLRGEVVVVDEEISQVLYDGQPLEVTVEFPPILEHDVGDRMDAIVKAATLDGKQRAGTMDDLTLVRLVLTALGISEVTEVTDLLNIDPATGMVVAGQDEGEAAVEALARDFREALVEFRVALEAATAIDQSVEEGETSDVP